LTYLANRVLSVAYRQCGGCTDAQPTAVQSAVSCHVPVLQSEGTSTHTSQRFHSFRLHERQKRKVSVFEFEMSDGGTRTLVHSYIRPFRPTPLRRGATPHARGTRFSALPLQSLKTAINKMSEVTCLCRKKTLQKVL